MKTIAAAIAIAAALAAAPQAKTLRVLCTSAYTSYTMEIQDVRSYAYLRDFNGRTFLRVTLSDGSLLDINAPETKILK